MQINMPTFELHEPLRPKPLTGAVIGLVTGLGIGLLRGGAVAWPQVVTGYGLAGLSAGMIIGVTIPLFRRRSVAGLMVGVAMTIALFILMRSSNQDITTANIAFLGLSFGFVYAALLWRYYPAPPDAKTPNERHAKADDE